MNNIKFVVFDFDGVFTDSKFYFNKLDVTKTYNCKDAASLLMLKESNIKTGIITADKILSIEYAPHIFNRLTEYSIGEDLPKLEILSRWLEKYDLSYSDVAYIGDDSPDIEILKKVFFSACPSDAINDVKNICDYVCLNKGGDGAVREFVEKVIEKNKVNRLYPNDEKITAIIPVRKGSKRVKFKNVREFGESNLLEMKIHTLKKINRISEIIVSTDCDEMEQISKDLGVIVHKRKEYYASDECPNHKYWKHIAESVGTHSNFMMVNCVSPLLTEGQINKFIDSYIENNYKSAVTSTKHKKFFYNSITNKPINFNSYKAPNSQLLNPLNEITFGLCIANRQEIIESECIYGKYPMFFELDSVSGIDIDTPSEFISAELFKINNIHNNSINETILNHRLHKMELIDCTIRDGGYLNNWDHSDTEIVKCYKAVTNAGFDYFEIGFKSNRNILKGKGKWCYSDEKDINNIIKMYKGTKICVMAKLGTVNINDFIDKKLSNINMVRVLVPRLNSNKNSEYDYDSIIKAKQFCIDLIGLGYEVCLNLGCGDLITTTEIELIISIIHDIKIKCLYLADTYGGFNSVNLPIQIHKFYSQLNKYQSNIRIGLHFHNNNGNALEKYKISKFHGASMIDTSIYGLGRGAGNLKTEEYLCEKYTKKDVLKAKMESLVIYFDKYIISKKNYFDGPVQAHPYYNIAGALSLHPDYINDILLNSKTTPSQDLDMIFKLDKYTIDNNIRNYDSKLIKFLVENNN